MEFFARACGPTYPPPPFQRSGRKELVHTLRKIELFKCLNVQKVQSLADIMTEVQYEAGETIVKQGGSGDSFYVIRSGNCVKSSKVRWSGRVRVFPSIPSQSSNRNTTSPPLLAEGNEEHPRDLGREVSMCEKWVTTHAIQYFYSNALYSLQ